MSPERKRWKYADHVKAFHQGHAFAPYVMDFKGCLEASAEDDTLSKKARQIMDGLKLFEWGNFSDAPVDPMPAVERTDPQPRDLTQAEIAARLGISPSTFSEGCSELRAKGYLPVNSSSLNLSESSRSSANRRSCFTVFQRSERGVKFGLHEFLSISSFQGHLLQREPGVGSGD